LGFPQREGRLFKRKVESGEKKKLRLNYSGYAYNISLTMEREPQKKAKNEFETITTTGREDENVKPRNLGSQKFFCGSDNRGKTCASGRHQL